MKALSLICDPKPDEPATRTVPSRHTASMDDVVYMVRGKTEAICRQALDQLCELLGAHPTMLPTDGTGRGWVARAVPSRDTERGQQ